MFICLALLLAVPAFLIVWIVSLVYKQGKSARWLVSALACAVLFLAALMTFYGPDTDVSADASSDVVQEQVEQEELTDDSSSENNDVEESVDENEILKDEIKALYSDTNPHPLVIVMDAYDGGIVVKADYSSVTSDENVDDEMALTWANRFISDALAKDSELAQKATYINIEFPSEP